MTTRKGRTLLAAGLACLMLLGAVVAFGVVERIERVRVTAYFANTNGLYAGDQVRILGVPVGEVETITPGRDNAKVTFWFNGKYTVPADAEAAILAPGLVSARVIQLTPAYTGGPALADAAVIPQQRTAVPAEYDDLRVQLEKLNESLQPTTPGGVAPAGALINTGAANLRGRGADVRRSLIELSQALSALGDHSGDISGTVKNLSVLVTALGSSADLLEELNTNMAAVTSLMNRKPQALATMVRDLDLAVRDVNGFVADNRETLGTTSEKLGSITTMLHERLPELKQILHVSPNSLANFANVYRPATASFAGTFAVTNFANPLQFICSSIQAASRLNYERAAKLCVQYLAPIFKNREYNFPPIGTTMGLLNGLPVAGAMARPNEITFSEDWMRPDHIPPGAATTDPAAGLSGLMVPQGGGS
ncbi:MCE family protein [[Mycobacterium] burgundiense]|uniref:MCE family protein n=1 Tax=[Mycobacterium] burgundiense TaxID=3064286 RepID=A0ABN9MVP9_9MYCO|nr:MCE family protein [Mycolicibacterium sp. MU0053]CAJ1496058.1 MCE family protein [Mycolicibacterium sp. MU0053]